MNKTRQRPCPWPVLLSLACVEAAHSASSVSRLHLRAGTWALQVPAVHNQPTNGPTTPMAMHPWRRQASSAHPCLAICPTSPHKHTTTSSPSSSFLFALHATPPRFPSARGVGHNEASSGPDGPRVCSFIGHSHQRRRRSRADWARRGHASYQRRTVPYGTVKRYHTNCTNCTLYTVRTHNKLVQSVQSAQ